MRKFLLLLFLLLTGLFLISLDGGNEDKAAVYENERNDTISVSEIIALSNAEREKRGLSAFHENQLLNRAAEMKLNDMISNQYFAHVSPSGEEVGSLADLVGYQFISVGENLAKGNFSDSQDLVKGWMESPGHRDNILHLGYREIGSAVKKAEYQGDRIWLAVQIFGLPIWVCPEPDRDILATINKKQEEAEILIGEIELLKKEIRDFYPRDREKIEEYNNLVSRYNEILKESEILVAQYNKEVTLTNKCIESYGF